MRRTNANRELIDTAGNVSLLCVCVCVCVCVYNVTQLHNVVYMLCGGPFIATTDIDVMEDLHGTSLTEQTSQDVCR